MYRGSRYSAAVTHSSSAATCVPHVIGVDKAMSMVMLQVVGNAPPVICCVCGRGSGEVKTSLGPCSDVQVSSLHPCFPTQFRDSESRLVRF